jgi:predicted phosphodiesterase
LSLRLAVLSDIHGNLVALEAVLADLKQAGGADKTWVLGDLCAFGPRPVECLQVIRELPNAKVISGNTDRYLVTGERPSDRPKDEAEWRALPDKLRQREANFAWTVSKLSFADYEFLTKLRHELSLEAPGYGWLIGYHGAPGDDERIILPDTPAEEALDQMLDREARLGFGGHTHTPMDRDLGTWRLVNVGSVGMPKDMSRANYALVTIDDGTANVDLRNVEYDLQAVATDMQQLDHPMWPSVMESIKRASQ